ncbi:uncharacterized protein LOC134676976 [Cydia fagiglandana]|uniref:uncharacterized protein LOC134676976 n=1 Tax=Cydia fagiglandana TaxID=1458189 RepID=UPI002FEE4DF7
MLPVKYLSLQKSELEYEVQLRGATAGSSVEELRRQIVKLAAEHPAEHILESPLDIRQDLRGCVEVLTKIQLNLDISEPSVPTIMRTQNMLNHLHNRLARITCGDDRKEYKDILEGHKVASQKLAALQAKRPTQITTTSSNLGAGPSSETSTAAPGVQNLISVTCDRTVADLSKLKFNGKTCVRSFIQRVDEFIVARNIASTKVLAFATEIFQDNALHWFRSVRDNISSWPELAAKLKEDFDQSNYDYRLTTEIRSRTQGEHENITVYLSIMSGMFSRLSTPPSEAEQLETLLHNIRPCYASTLAASSTEIRTIDSLRSLCRNYETYHSRHSQFQEPPRVTSDTVAPEFAYSRESNKSTNKFNNNTYNKQNYTYNNNYNKGQYSKNTTNYSQNQNQNKSQQQNYIHSVSNAAQNNKQQPYCPRCRSNNHHIRQCTASRDVFCFKCGKKDVKTPDCPVCNKKADTKN